MAQSQKDSLLSGSPAGRASIFFVWPGTDPRSAPDTIDHTVGETQRRTSGWGGVEEVWRLSLPWSPMALLTIQHPLNYPPIRSHRDKGPVLVYSRNMATNLSDSNITPTSQSLQVRRGHDCTFFFFFLPKHFLLLVYLPNQCIKSSSSTKSCSEHWGKLNGEFTSSFVKFVSRAVSRGGWDLTARLGRSE